MRHPAMKPLEDAGFKVTFDWMEKDYGIECFISFSRTLSYHEKRAVKSIAINAGVRDCDISFNDDNGTTELGITEAN